MDYAKVIRELLGDTRAAKATKMGLTTPAYHGTVAPEFTEFRPSEDYWLQTNAYAGTHFAADPQIAKNMVANRQEFQSPAEVLVSRPRVIEAMIPSLKNMQTVQSRPNYSDAEDIDSHLLRAFYRAHPEDLERAIARESGSRIKLGHQPYGPEGERDILEALTANDPNRFMVTEQYGGQPYLRYAGPGRVAMAAAEPTIFADEALKQQRSMSTSSKRKIAAAGVAALQEEGALGLIYRNTMGPEIAGAADPTSYIVFDPAHIRDQRAAFDARRRRSRNLMYGLGAATVLGGLSGDTHADEEQY